MSFQKLMRDADEQSGLSHQLSCPIQQNDTSAIDEMMDEDESDEETESNQNKINRWVHLSEPGMETLRNSIHRVTVSDSKDSAVKKCYLKPANRPQQSSISMERLMIPFRDWEQEVRMVMDPDGPQHASDLCFQDTLQLNTGHNGTGIPRLRAIDFEVSGFQCFAPDLVDIDQPSDPLDVVIPNAPTHRGPASQRSGPSDRPEHHEFTFLRQLRQEESRLTQPAEEGEPSEEPVELDSFANRKVKDRQRKLQKAQRIKNVSIGFNAAASIEQSALLMGKRPRDSLPLQRSGRGNRSQIAALNHSRVATAHKNTKPDLYEVELRYFHRPRMIKERDRPWQISISAPAKKNAANSLTKLAQTDADRQNLSLAGNECNFILVEYIEEHPSVMLNHGMASGLFNYYRAPRIGEAEDEEEDRPSHKRRTLGWASRLDITGSAALRHTHAQQCRLPRHVQLLLQQQKMRHYDHDVAVPRLGLGETKILSPEDEAPFLGPLDEGEIQPALANNLFRVPLFKHEPRTTDFLLIRTKLLQKGMSYTLREIPHMFVAGQQEPQRIVPRPVQRITHLQEQFYLLAIARYLQSNFDGSEMTDLQRSVLKYCLKEHSAPHKHQHRSKFKDIVRKVGEEAKDVNGLRWYAKDFHERATSYDEALELERRFSPEEIARSFSPEDVCLQEASNAAEYRLFQQHVTDVDLSKVEAWLTVMHRRKQFRSERVKMAQQLLDSLPAQSPRRESAGKLVKLLTRDVERLEGRMAVARWLFKVLVKAPWNTTEAYVRSHIERDGQGRMNLLEPAADPSGRAEAFSFVRIAKLAAVEGPGPDGTARKHEKLFDTDKDLRKLTKKDAVRLLVAVGVKEADAMALRRWDRIHMIREASTKMEKSGLAKELHKYARGEQMKGLPGVGGVSAEDFKAVCRQIWNKQKQALSVSAPAQTLEDAGKGLKAIENQETLPVQASGVDEMEKKTKSDVEAEEAQKEVTEQAPDGGGLDSDSDSDIEKDIEQSLAARAAATAREKAQAEARTQQKQAAAVQEQRELSSMGKFFDQLGQSQQQGTSSTGPTKKRVSVGVSGAGDDDLPASTQDEEAAERQRASRAQWPRPAKVVKRVTRAVNPFDGSETIKIEFLFVSSAEINAVQRANAKQKRDREQRRARAAAFGGPEEAVEEDEDHPTTLASMSLNLGKMKKAVDLNNQQLKRERAMEEGRGGLRGSLLDDGFGGSNKSTKRAAATTTLNTRLPRIGLAACLEKELMDLWKAKNAHFFRFPVSEAEVPGYHAKIQRPISLTEIREKIASCQYETAAAMLEDVTLMARNSEQFNGPVSHITVTAFKLVEKLRASLEHDRLYLGPEKDPIRLLEEAIQRKKAYLKKRSAEASAHKGILGAEALMEATAPRRSVISTDASPDPAV